MNRDGTAFPTGTYEYDGSSNVLPYQTEGLSVRDYIAIEAMKALISRKECHSSYDRDIVCELAYKYADRMIKESNNE